MSAKVDCWTLDDAPEELTESDRDEAIERWLDSRVENVGETVEETLARLPETVEVYGYARRKLTPNDIDGELILDRIMEPINEEFGDPDERFDPISDADRARILALAEALATAIRDVYVPWTCEQVCTEKVNLREWVREHGADFGLTLAAEGGE